MNIITFLQQYHTEILIRREIEVRKFLKLGFPIHELHNPPGMGLFTDLSMTSYGFIYEFNTHTYKIRDQNPSIHKLSTLTKEVYVGCASGDFNKIYQLLHSEKNDITLNNNQALRMALWLQNCNISCFLVVCGAQIPENLTSIWVSIGGPKALREFENFLSPATKENYNLFLTYFKNYLPSNYSAFIQRLLNPNKSTIDYDFVKEFNALPLWAQYILLSREYIFKNKDNILHRVISTENTQSIQDAIKLLVTTSNQSKNILAEMLNQEDINQCSPGTLLLFHSSHMPKPIVENLISTMIRYGAKPDQIKSRFEDLDKNPDYNALGLGGVRDILEQEINNANKPKLIIKRT